MRMTEYQYIRVSEYHIYVHNHSSWIAGALIESEWETGPILAEMVNIRVKL